LLRRSLLLSSATEYKLVLIYACLPSDESNDAAASDDMEAEMDVKGKWLLPTSPQKTWEALNSPEVLKACIPGCESITDTGSGHFEIVQVLAVAGFKTRFSSTLTLEDPNPPHSYVLRFEGNAGSAGFGLGRALVALQPTADGGTQMNYQATAEVGGAIGQLGKGTVDSTAQSLAETFFSRFDQVMRGQLPVDDGAGASTACGA